MKKVAFGHLQPGMVYLLFEGDTVKVRSLGVREKQEFSVTPGEEWVQECYQIWDEEDQRWREDQDWDHQRADRFAFVLYFDWKDLPEWQGG